ncbi:hypothetical protein GCK72_003099 [Caenorhabditis remanei]|uniref:Uncharacterized protein n=1 Tax=Caenorhabditis remanei TaxID=31234 RepID=A0A6A5HXM6_CAERE|nr:hypothetical protein GCK72_003099 [Caenorhabditis remanei]KAF1771273.1 hypothetical protein GCK72_003099 [Caenorhabditis remanei]
MDQDMVKHIVKKHVHQGQGFRLFLKIDHEVTSIGKTVGEFEREGRGVTQCCFHILALGFTDRYAQSLSNLPKEMTVAFQPRYHTNDRSQHPLQKWKLYDREHFNDLASRSVSKKLRINKICVWNKVRRENEASAETSTAETVLAIQLGTSPPSVYSMSSRMDMIQLKIWASGNRVNPTLTFKVEIVVTLNKPTFSSSLLRYCSTSKKWERCGCFVCAQAPNVCESCLGFVSDFVEEICDKIRQKMKEFDLKVLEQHYNATVIEDLKQEVEQQKKEIDVWRKGTNDAKMEILKFSDENLQKVQDGKHEWMEKFYNAQNEFTSQKTKYSVLQLTLTEKITEISRLSNELQELKETYELLDKSRLEQNKKLRNLAKDLGNQKDNIEDLEKKNQKLENQNEELKKKRDDLYNEVRGVHRQDAEFPLQCASKEYNHDRDWSILGLDTIYEGNDLDYIRHGTNLFTITGRVHSVACCDNCLEDSNCCTCGLLKVQW